MSVTTQIIFPFMSDARAPAMDVHMTPQNTGMARSFWLILSALLIEDDGFHGRELNQLGVKLLSTLSRCPHAAHVEFAAVCQNARRRVAARPASRVGRRSCNAASLQRRGVRTKQEASLDDRRPCFLTTRARSSRRLARRLPQTATSPAFSKKARRGATRGLFLFQTRTRQAHATQQVKLAGRLPRSLDVAAAS